MQSDRYSIIYSVKRGATDLKALMKDAADLVSRAANTETGMSTPKARRASEWPVGEAYIGPPPSPYFSPWLSVATSIKPVPSLGPIPEVPHAPPKDIASPKDTAATKDIASRRTLGDISYLLSRREVVDITQDLQHRVNQRLIKANSESEATPPASVILDDVYKEYEKDLYSSDDPAAQARAAFAMASINIAKRYQQGDVIPDMGKLLLALDTNDDGHLDTAEIRAIYNNVASQMPGMPKLTRPEGFGAWFTELMDQLNTTQKVLLAIGAPLGAIGLMSALIRGPDAGNIIMGIAGLGATIGAFTAAGVMPGSRAFDINQLKRTTGDISQLIDKEVVKGLQLLSAAATDNDRRDLLKRLGVPLAIGARPLSHEEIAEGKRLWERIAAEKKVMHALGARSPVDLYNAISAINNKITHTEFDVRVFYDVLLGLCFNAATDKNYAEYIKQLGLDPIIPPKDGKGKILGWANNLMEMAKTRTNDTRIGPHVLVDNISEQYHVPKQAFNDALARLKSEYGSKK